MNNRTDGFAVIVALTLVAILTITLATYSIVTVNNVRTSASSAGASSGFYAAEAALNSRGEQIRQKFKGFGVPQGTTPSAAKPCQGSNTGAGDLICQSANVGGHAVTSYVKKSDSQTITIPPGEDFENLSAEETPFTVYGTSVGSTNNPEAIATLVLRSRLVPLFQFAVFFDKDLEFTNTATLNLSGPVHTNGNLFLDAGSGASLTISGQTTAAGQLFRGVKHANSCTGGTVRVTDPGGTNRTIACASGRSAVTQATLDSLGGRLKTLPRLEVPRVEQLQPTSDAQYWQKADVRIVLKRNGSNWNPLFVRAGGSQIPVSSSNCGPALTSSQTLRDNREAQYWETTGTGGGNDATRASRRTLDVDVRRLLACIQDNRAALGLAAAGLGETTDGGLVLYMTVDDVDGGSALSAALGGLDPTGSSQGNNPNNYAVRLRNGERLRSTNTTHPAPLGITFVTDEAVFIEGDFNNFADRAAGWIPAAIMADSVNVLSSDWSESTPCLYKPGNTTFYMSRTEYRRLNNRNYTRGELSSSQWSNSTALRTATVSAMGQTWSEYTAGNYGAELGETFQGDAKSEVPLWCRNAQATTVKAAILAGTAVTGSEGGLYPSPTPGSPAQSGGVHNMMRFHENWGSNSGHPNGAVAYTYRGSLVSLNPPLHARGDFKLGENRFYEPPLRQWSFEEEFRDSANLPPLTPRFVYLKQDNFTRQFEQ